MNEPILEKTPPFSKPSQKQGNLRQIMSGIRLLFFGLVIVLVVQLVLYDQMDLLYPYLNPPLLIGLQVIGIVGFLIPGCLFLMLNKYGKYLDSPQIHQIPSYVKYLYIIAGVCSCIGILGIRDGVKILITLRSKAQDQIPETNIWDATEGLSAYRLYLISGGFYLLVFGLLLLGVIDLLQVVTIDLAYPTLTQALIIGLETWIWLCLMAPAILFLGCSFILTPKSSYELRGNLSKMSAIGAMFAMISVFGISIGVKLIQNRWMIQPVDKK